MAIKWKMKKKVNLCAISFLFFVEAHRLSFSSFFICHFLWIVNVLYFFFFSSFNIVCRQLIIKWREKENKLTFTDPTFSVFHFLVLRCELNVGLYNKDKKTRPTAHILMKGMKGNRKCINLQKQPSFSFS